MKHSIFSSLTLKHPFPTCPGLRFSMQFLFGGIAYGLAEVIWRGYTHPSMVLTGGICFTMICLINQKWKQLPLIVRSIVCAFGITAIEFCVGIIVNFLLHMDVWDYSNEWMHLLGQICPLYSCLWFFLSFSISLLLSAIPFFARIRQKARG